MPTDTETQAFHKEARAIARTMKGWNYNAKRSKNRDGLLPAVAYFIRHDGLELSITLDWRKSDRMNASQNYHTQAWKDTSGQTHDPTSYNERLPSISFARKKTAEAKGRDILRRLVPGCEAFHKIGCERAEGYSKALGVQAKACKALGVSFDETSRQNRRGRPYRRLDGPGHMNGSVSVGTCGTADMKLENLTPAQARRVMELLDLE